MAITVTYLTVEGEVISETREGLQLDYIPDPLGNTVALSNSSFTLTDTFSWWPYGEVRSHVGVSDTPFGFCGTLGYYTNSLGSTIQVRFRTLVTQSGRWTTIDEMWPSEYPFAYSDSSPVTNVDVFGLSSQNGSDPIETSINNNLGKGPRDCGQWLRKVLGDAGITAPPGQADDWPPYFRKHPDEWEQVPNDGKHIRPHDIQCTSRGDQDHGHVGIYDNKCCFNAASLNAHNGSRGRYPWRPGRICKDNLPGRNGTITIWRHKPRHKRK